MQIAKRKNNRTVYLPFGDEASIKTDARASGAYAQPSKMYATSSSTQLAKKTSEGLDDTKKNPPSNSYTLKIDENTTGAQLMELLGAFLRPGTDDAIKDRKRQSAYNGAEIDADASSRGMLGSTFVSSMKQRERDEAAEDIASYEAQYQATLASYLYDAMFEISRMKSQGEQFDRDMQYKYDALNRSSRSSGGSSSGSGETRDEEDTNSFLSYMDSLDDSEKRQLFYDMGSFWKGRRDMIIDAIGGRRFDELVSYYMDLIMHKERKSYGRSQIRGNGVGYIDVWK